VWSARSWNRDEVVRHAGQVDRTCDEGEMAQRCLLNNSRRDC